MNSFFRQVPNMENMEMTAEEARDAEWKLHQKQSWWLISLHKYYNKGHVQKLSTLSTELSTVIHRSFPRNMGFSRLSTEFSTRVLHVPVRSLGWHKICSKILSSKYFPKLKNIFFQIPWFSGEKTAMHTYKRNTGTIFQYNCHVLREGRQRRWAPGLQCAQPGIHNSPGRRSWRRYPRTAIGAA